MCVLYGQSERGKPIQHERNKMNAVLWRSAGKWADCRPECLVSGCAFRGLMGLREGAHFMGNFEQLTISGLSTGWKRAHRARVFQFTRGRTDPAKSGSCCGRMGVKKAPVFRPGLPRRPWIPHAGGSPRRSGTGLTRT